MKNFWKATLFCFLLIFGHQTFAQRWVDVSLGGERIQFSDRNIQSYGLTFDVYLSDNISLSYRLALGANSSRAFYSQLPMGVWLAANVFEDQFFDLEGILALTIILPEAIYFNFPASRLLDVGFFVAPLGMFYEDLDRLDNPSFRPGFSTGVRLNIIKDNYVISPYIGGRALYSSTAQWGLLVGASIGLRLGDY